MNLVMVILRIIHIFGGIFWLGIMWYNVLFFLPRVKTFGQERGRIMQMLSGPPLPQYLTLAGAGTALSGILMFWYASAGLNKAWLATPTGVVLAIAGLLGIYVVVEGLIVQRPTAMRMAELGRRAALAGGPPNPVVTEEMQKLSSRLERTAYRYAYVLALSAIGMAAFRYV
ncbi:MAG TPA: hypothetical protein VFJ45_06905 [bacterium]|nr:hypothetical protein [bacterium]